MMHRILLLIFITIIASCKSPEPRKPITQNSGSTINESILKNKELIAQEEKAIQDLIARDNLTQYIASNSGFWYTYITRDSSATKTPIVGDLVNFTYNLQTLNGDILLSHEDIGNQITQIDQSNQELVSGIRDGLKIMKEGETVLFLFPSHKAYGYYGLDDKIGSSMPIKSAITLLKIKDNKPK